MGKNFFVKLGVVGLVAMVGASAYSTAKRIKTQKEQEVIEITAEEAPQK